MVGILTKRLGPVSKENSFQSRLSFEKYIKEMKEMQTKANPTLKKKQNKNGKKELNE